MKLNELLAKLLALLMRQPKWLNYAVLIIGLIVSGGYNQKMITSNKALKVDLRNTEAAYLLYNTAFEKLMDRHTELRKNYSLLKKEMASARTTRAVTPSIPTITTSATQSTKRSPVSVLGFVNTSSWGMGAGYELGSLSLPKLPRTCFTLSGVAGRTWQDKWEFGGILTLGFEKIVK